VTWAARKSRWLARIRVDGRLIQLGYLADEEAAARASDAAARQNFAAFARLNFPAAGEQAACR
jgi:hypothetical protein